MTAEDEEAMKHAQEQTKDQAPMLPERLKFKGLKEALQLLFMRSKFGDGIRERIESAMLFISTVSDMLDIEPDEEAKQDAKALHDFVANYHRPRFRRSMGMSQDGIVVRVIEEPGAEKNRHQFLPGDYRAVTDLLDEGLAEHFIRDVAPWFTAAEQIARAREYLRPEGETLGFLTEEPERMEEEQQPGEDDQPEDEGEGDSDDDVFDVEGEEFG